MSQPIKVSVLCAPLPAVEGRCDAHECVSDYWREQFALVLPNEPDLIVLPELCDQPAGMSWQDYFVFIEQHGSQIAAFFADFAAQHRVLLTYPTAHPGPHGGWLNSIKLLDRRGVLLGKFDKRFPTISELDAGFVPGTRCEPIECELGRVGGLICFDLNFNELRGELVQDRLDLVLFCSQFHGGLLLPQWAYECGTHLVAAVANLPGAVFSPLGETLATTTNYHPYQTAAINLDCRTVHLDYHREKLVLLKQKYGPRATVHDPGLIGSVLVTSNDAHRTADDLLREFDIEPTQQYFERSRQRCRAVSR